MWSIKCFYILLLCNFDPILRDKSVAVVIIGSLIKTIKKRKEKKQRQQETTIKIK